MGGVGKTRAAIEYAWKHANDYRALLFISADTPEALHRNLAALCGPLVLNLPERNEKEQALQVEAALRWLKLKRSDGIASAASAGAMHLDRSRFGKVNATCRSPPFTSNYS